MEKQAYEKVLGDVSKHFKTPEDLFRATDLTRQQKLELLKQWDYDLQLLMVASEENMPAPPTGKGSGRTSEIVRQVHDMVQRLGAENDPDKAGPAKAGGLSFN
jgi:hypothetical protein